MLERMMFRFEAQMAASVICPMYKTEPRARQYALQSVNAADIFCPVNGKTMLFPSIALHIVLICSPQFSNARLIT